MNQKWLLFEAALRQAINILTPFAFSNVTSHAQLMPPNDTWSLMQPHIYVHVEKN